ncbi:hypothetical protein DFH09DRAFT_1434201 [Mycena vulgaris]|nr:hypothetical protein DFH09DRAFT_1434201 [Mycena vulgaris]
MPSPRTDLKLAIARKSDLVDNEGVERVVKYWLPVEHEKCSLARTAEDKLRETFQHGRRLEDVTEPNKGKKKEAVKKRLDAGQENNGCLSTSPGDARDRIDRKTASSQLQSLRDARKTAIFYRRQATGDRHLNRASDLAQARGTDVNRIKMGSNENSGEKLTKVDTRTQVRVGQDTSQTLTDYLITRQESAAGPKGIGWLGGKFGGRNWQK